MPSSSSTKCHGFDQDEKDKESSKARPLGFFVPRSQQNEKINEFSAQILMKFSTNFNFCKDAALSRTKGPKKRYEEGDFIPKEEGLSHHFIFNFVQSTGIIHG